MFEQLKRGAGEGGPTRESWNRMCDLLESLKIETGPGLLYRRGPTGTTLRVQQRRVSQAVATGVQFEVYDLRKVDDAWKCKLRPGWLLNTNPSSGAPPFAYGTPTAGGVALDAAEPPDITVTAGQTLYLRLLTDIKDQPSSAPTIVADEPEKEGTHYQPDPVGVSGEYWYRLADIGEDPNYEAPEEGEADPPLVVLKQWQQGGPIMHRPVIDELKNVGGERGIYKTLNAADNSHEIRSLEQLAGGQVPVIKALNPGEDAVLDGEGGVITPAVPPEEEGDTIKFHNFAVESGVPVSFVNEDNGPTNFLKFDGADGSINLPGGGIITALKGIVTVLTEGDDGWTGTITWDHADGIAGNNNSLKVTFDKGILVKVEDSGSGGTLADVPGTEGSPGTAQFQSWN